MKMPPIDVLDEYLDEVNRPEPNPDAVTPRTLQREERLGIGGGGRTKGRAAQPKGNPTCQCGHRADRHGEPSSGVGCLHDGCECTFFLQASAEKKPRRAFNVRIAPEYRKVLNTHPGLAREVLERVAKRILANDDASVV